MRTFGADVSHWEGDINWLLGVDYLPFVYYKATDGTSWVDTQFLSNKAECNMVGVPHAPYHWWQEAQDPIVQADHFTRTVMPGYKQLIVDVEPKINTGRMLSDLTKLLERIESNTGIIPAIYTSAYFWNGFVKTAYPNHHPLLVANYAYASEPILPVGATGWKIWQFTDMFWFSGCDATADGNWFNGDLTQCRSWFGNYHPYELPPPPVTGDFKMKCIVDTLNVRSGPGTSYSIKGHLHNGETVTLKDIGGTAAWMQIKDGPYAGYWCAVQTSLRYMNPV